MAKMGRNRQKLAKNWHSNRRKRAETGENGWKQTEMGGIEQKRGETGKNKGKRMETGGDRRKRVVAS